MKIMHMIFLLGLILVSCTGSEPADTGPVSGKLTPKPIRLGYDYEFEAEGKKFRTFVSYEYGASDIWLEYSTDGKKYKKVFTGCALVPDASAEMYMAAYADGKIVISYERSISEGGDAVQTRFTATLAELVRDSDSDGLPDLVEYRFQTNATRPDTDEDGVKDGADSNPLASSKIKLTEQQQIWKAGLLQYQASKDLSYQKLPSEGIILAVFESDEYFFELPGEKNTILAMTVKSVEKFGRDNGFYLTQAYFSEVMELSPEDGRRRVAFELDVILDPRTGTRCKLTLEKRENQWKIIGTELTRIY